MTKRKTRFVPRPATGRIALYIRVSTEEQADNPEGSIKSQEQRLRAHVEYRNSQEPFGEVAAVYIDRAKSGKDTKRPELQRMLSSITRGEVTHVLVSELSRLSRNIRDFIEMWELMETSGCQFQSLREQVDTSTAAGRMVINSMMNFAQFEREQTAERVTANLIARSARGLYNGGIVPMGYKPIPDKKGYLEIDETVAPMIRRAFAAFLSEESLSAAAKWLNENGERIPRQMRSGGGKPRLGHFTIDNLHFILRNKAYAGIKTHTVKGEVREAKAVWDAIIDPVTFARVQELLSKNYCRKKPLNSRNRYPFLFAGIAHCGTCGDRLSGKSANGNGGKIAYYEHAWSTKKQACLVKKVFDCKPNRVLAKRIEPVVWDTVQELLRKSAFAKELIAEATSTHQKRTQDDECLRFKERIQAMDSQLEALAERVGSLPAAVSPEPFYKQMEKIQELKKQEQAKLAAAEADSSLHDVPAQLPEFEAFLKVLSSFATDPIAVEARIKIVQKVISKIEIRPGSYKLHFHVGRNHIQGELAQAGSLFLWPKVPKKKAESAFADPALTFSNRSLLFSSHSLTNGWGTRTRT